MRWVVHEVGVGSGRGGWCVRWVMGEVGGM